MIVFSTEPEKTTSSARTIFDSPMFFNKLEISLICLLTDFKSLGDLLDTKSFLPSNLVQSRNIMDSLFISRYILSRDTMGISP